MQEIRWRPTSGSLFWSPSSMGNEKSTLEMLLCFCRWSSRISNQFIARKLESFHTRSPIFLDCQRKSWSSMETHRRNLTISKVSSYVTPREGLLLSYGLGVNKEKKKMKIETSTRSGRRRRREFHAIEYYAALEIAYSLEKPRNSWSNIFRLVSPYYDKILP